MKAPMLPNQPECGSPCSTCEALAHENGRLRDENARLKAAIALGQQNCDDAYQDLRDERDAAKADNTRLRVALTCICRHGGMTADTECGPINCSGFWCAEQARAALAEGGAK